MAYERSATDYVLAPCTFASAFFAAGLPDKKK
jgi:hypothetical protein